MRQNQKLRVISSVLLIILTTSGLFSQDKLTRKALERLKDWENPLTEWQHISKPKLDSIHISEESSVITLFYAAGLSYYPYREESYNIFVNSLKEELGKKFRNWSIEVVTNGFSLGELIPNYYRKELAPDMSRMPSIRSDKQVLIRRSDSPVFHGGLSENSIALWHSHGYYFEMNLDRWEYQRAKLFGTVEDISVMGYVVPYLTKMLENAGANVFLPRERDLQINEVIVDNDRSTGLSEVVIQLDSVYESIDEGFLLSDTLFPGHNPFRHGTSLRIKNNSAIYIPDIPENGYYGIYVAYPARKDNSTEVKYIVNHTGGNTEFVINQTIGGGTWIYLDSFHFRKGKDQINGSLAVTADDGSVIALDAVRFGGGMGNVARRPSPEIIKNQLSVSENQQNGSVNPTTVSSQYSWKLSRKPRFLEAARYYLQYAGMPDTLVYSPNTYKNDYNDDYQSRGLWVNYMIKDPYVADSVTGLKGLGLPIDLSFAFHTDAGITPDDSIIGTLAIYSTGSVDGKFPDGSSRLAGRDLSDIIQTQVVEDIRAQYKKDWTRRGLWDRPYSEARRPDVPAVLLELLSHQNLSDQRFGLDPRFRSDVSRSIYKGILKYLAFVEKRDYAVQPLPVDHFAITPVTGKKVRLSWQPVVEANEPTSKPGRYIIYMRRGDNGFDNGTVVNETYTDIELGSYDTLYSFKVTAVNDGGESFGSEILSVGLREGDNRSVIVVNGFDRISGPSWFDNNEMAGVAWWNDRGVADNYDFINVGDQYDFNRNNPWLDDDSPGWGASYSDAAGKVIKGNNFDYTIIHGRAIMDAGHSFFSVSDEFFFSSAIKDLPFETADFIFGEEKSTPFFYDTSRVDFSIYTPEFMRCIEELALEGKNIFMSGAYLGSELMNSGDTTAIKFVAEHLHFAPRTDHAVRIGELYATDQPVKSFSGKFVFNTEIAGPVYQVEAPDAIEPSGKGSICAFRYTENNSSAGIAYSGINKTVILGFPFETITDAEQRTSLMKQILTFLRK